MCNPVGSKARDKGTKQKWTKMLETIRKNSEGKWILCSII